MRAGAKNQRPTTSPASGPKPGSSSSSIEPRFDSTAVSTSRLPVIQMNGERGCFAHSGKRAVFASSSMSAAPSPSLIRWVCPVMASSRLFGVLRSAGVVDTRLSETKLVTTSFFHSGGRRLTGISTPMRRQAVP